MGTHIHCDLLVFVVREREREERLRGRKREGGMEREVEGRRGNERKGEKEGGIEREEDVLIVHVLIEILKTRSELSG